MLGKVKVKGLGLTNVNLEPCPYQNLTLMGQLKKPQGLTKSKIMIQVNPNKPIHYTINACPSNGYTCHIL